MAGRSMATVGPGNNYIFWHENSTMWTKKAFTYPRSFQLVSGTWDDGGGTATITAGNNQLVAKNSHGDVSIFVNAGGPLSWQAYGGETAIFSPDGKTIYWGRGE